MFFKTRKKSCFVVKVLYLFYFFVNTSDDVQIYEQNKAVLHKTNLY